jgi:hypothetical protein
VSGQVLHADVLRARGGAARGLRHPSALLAGWHAAIIILSGLGCRALNAAGHSADTRRTVLVIVGTALLAVFLLHRRGVYGPGSGRGAKPRLWLVIPVLHSFALMLRMPPPKAAWAGVARRFK